jgi:hypothetical protein
MHTLRTFRAYFKTEILPHLPKDDRPAVRQCWNDTVDCLMQDRQAPKSASAWVVPDSWESKGGAK